VQALEQELHAIGRAEAGQQCVVQYEQRDDPVGSGSRRAQRGVIVYAQVAGEQEDRRPHPS